MPEHFALHSQRALPEPSGRPAGRRYRWQRGSCCASEASTILPRITTSSSTLRLTRISPRSPTRSRRAGDGHLQVLAAFVAHHDQSSDRRVRLQRPGETICSRVSVSEAEARREVTTHLATSGPAQSAVCHAERPPGSLPAGAGASIASR